MTSLIHPPPVESLSPIARELQADVRRCKHCGRLRRTRYFSKHKRTCDECRIRRIRLRRNHQKNEREKERQRHILRTLAAERAPRVHLELVDECLRWFGGPAGFAEEVARWYADACDPSGRSKHNKGRGAPDQARQILRAVMRLIELSEARREEYEQEAAEFARWVDEL